LTGLRPRRVRQTRPRLDEATVGIGFVDVLFALVVGRILESLGWGQLHDIYGTEVANLLVATVITLASWIGYHNSLNRPRFKIRFPNWPLAQFVLDILMVFDYWLLATAAGAHGPNAVPNATTTAGLVVVAFLLYCAWDVVSFFIGRASRYQVLIENEGDRWKGYNPVRNATTWICTALAIVIWIVAGHNTGVAASYTIAALLIADALAFRVMKDHRWVRSETVEPAASGHNA
jgi:hypothetical protein